MQGKKQQRFRQMVYYNLSGLYCTLLEGIQPVVAEILGLKKSHNSKSIALFAFWEFNCLTQGENDSSIELSYTIMKFLNNTSLRENTLEPP